MPSKAHNSSAAARQARIRSRPAEPDSIADRVQVTRDSSNGGRILVKLRRKYDRRFSLDDDEAAYLSALLNKHLAPVTISRIEDRPGGES